MKVTREFYDIGGRKYIDLDGSRVKIPWRYNRVMCKVVGDLTVQELRSGSEVSAEITYKKWDGESFAVLKVIGPIIV